MLLIVEQTLACQFLNNLNCNCHSALNTETESQLDKILCFRPYGFYSNIIK